METALFKLIKSWKKLIAAYLLSSMVGLAAGMVMVKGVGIHPERIFSASTQRLAVALPVFEQGTRLGVDLGLLLFTWNVLGAMVTISFINAAGLFDPRRLDAPPRWARRIFSGRSRMKLLCLLPGCGRIEAEPLRRLYVWLMVPLLGLLLLGLESGLQICAATFFGNGFFSALMAFLPHGVIEIPAFALAGAIPYSAHLLVADIASDSGVPAVFNAVETHRRALPIKGVALIVIGALLVAGLIEAHLTPYLMQAVK